MLDQLFPVSNRCLLTCTRNIERIFKRCNLWLCKSCSMLRRAGAHLTRKHVSSFENSNLALFIIRFCMTIINISKVNIYQQYVCEILNTSTTKPADSVTERFIRSPTKYKLEVILA